MNIKRAERLQKLNKERRCRLWAIGQDYMDWIVSAVAEQQFVNWKQMDVPRDVIASGTFFDHYSLCFMIILWHESFPSVPGGEHIPLGGRGEPYLAPIPYKRIENYGKADTNQKATEM